MLIESVSSIKVSFISVLYFSNGTQFLNTTCVAAYMRLNNHKDLIQLTLLKTSFHHFVNNYR